MATTGQTDFLDLGLYQTGDYISYLGSFNDNMSKIDDFAKNTHATIGGLTEQQGATTADITKINSDISDLQSAQETITNKIADLPQLTSDVASLKVDNTANKTNIATLNTSVDTLTTMVNQDGTEISSLDDRVTALEDSSIQQKGLTYTVTATIPTSGSSVTIKIPDAINNVNASQYRAIFEYYIKDYNSGLNTLIKTEEYSLNQITGSHTIVDADSVFLPVKYSTNDNPATLTFYKLNVSNMTASPLDWGTRSMTFTDNSKLYYAKMSFTQGQAPAQTEIDTNGHRYNLIIKVTIYHQ